MVSDGLAPAAPPDVADYVRDMVCELAEMARRAGMSRTAATLHEAAHAAEHEARLIGQVKAAPGDAA